MTDPPQPGSFFLRLWLLGYSFALSIPTPGAVIAFLASRPSVSFPRSDIVVQNAPAHHSDSKHSRFRVSICSRRCLSSAEFFLPPSSLGTYQTLVLFLFFCFLRSCSQARFQCSPKCFLCVCGGLFFVSFLAACGGWWSFVFFFLFFLFWGFCVFDAPPF